MALKDTGNNREHDKVHLKKTKNELKTNKVEKVINKSKGTLSA